MPDIGEDVEGALGGDAGDAEIVEGGGDEVAAAAVFFAHGGDVFVGAFEGFEGGFLAGDGGAKHGVLMDFHHGADEVGGCAGVAEAEAGHGPGFGEAMEEDGALLHAG